MSRISSSCVGLNDIVCVSVLDEKMMILSSLWQGGMSFV